MIRSAPTWARIRSTCSSITAAGSKRVARPPRRRGSSPASAVPAACGRPRGHPVQAAVGVLEGSDGRRLRRRGDARSGGRGRDRVAVAHPHDLLAGEVVEQLRGSVELDVGLAVLRDVVFARPCLPARGPSAASHSRCRASGRRGRRCPGRRAGRPRSTRRPGRRRGSARTVAPAEFLGSEPVRDELRVDARLAHAPGDELAVLAAEVEDGDRPLLGRRSPGNAITSAVSATAVVRSFLRDRDVVGVASRRPAPVMRRKRASCSASIVGAPQ